MNGSSEPPEISPKSRAKSPASKPCESAADTKAARRAARKAKFATAPSHSSRPVNGDDDGQEGSHIAAFLQANKSFLSRGLAQSEIISLAPIARKASLSTVVEGLVAPGVCKALGPDAEDGNEDFLTRPDPLAGAKRILARSLNLRRFGSTSSDPGDTLFRNNEWLSEGSDGPAVQELSIFTGKTAIQEVLSDLSLALVSGKASYLSAMASSPLSAGLALDEPLYISGASTSASCSDQRGAPTKVCEPASPACSDDCSSTRIETGDTLPGMTACQADAFEKDLHRCEVPAHETAPAYPTGPNTNRPGRVRPKA